MRIAWIQWGSAVATAALALLLGGPLRAADETGVRTVAEELGNRMVPGSHRWGRLPQGALLDPMAPHPDEILLTGRAGSVVVMNAHMWHGGMGNRTARARTALHIFFCRRDKPQQQYQKGLLRPEVQAKLTPELRWLLALDDPLNDELAQSTIRRSGFLA